MKFELSEKEEKALKKFSLKHYEKCRLDGTPITFKPTGIGDVVTVHCPKCGKEKDITDVESW
jgi:hypothetical protein